jgi:magnesium-transporting ATPase (P-type)
MSETNVVNEFSGNSEFLINELIEEQKKLQNTTNDLLTAVNCSTPKVDNLKNSMEQLIYEKFKGLEKLIAQKLENSNNTSRQEDANSIHAILKKGLIDLKLILSTSPKGITKKFQILLFPEQDAKLFYKIVFGRWFMWLAVIVFLNFLYNWAIHWSDNNKKVRMEQLQNDRFTNAWNYLYKKSNKGTRRLMDSAWVKSGSK